MKSNVLSLICGAAVGLAVGSLICFKLHNRRQHTGGSFRELYNDNREEGAEK